MTLTDDMTAGCRPYMDSIDPYFDRHQPLDTHYSRDLPHWEQDGKLQYVTFRLVDSLPQDKIAELKQITADFERLHPKPWSPETTQKYWQLIGPVEARLLDNGYGSCVLKCKNIRDILTSTIFFFDKIKYDVVAFVIMPNHVHMVLFIYAGHSLEKIMHSIKSYSATRINKLLNRAGTMWLKENFDRIVRSEAHLDHCIKYIKCNPTNLQEGDFSLYINYGWPAHGGTASSGQ